MQHKDQYEKEKIISYQRDLENLMKLKRVKVPQVKKMARENKNENHIGRMESRNAARMKTFADSVK